MEELCWKVARMCCGTQNHSTCFHLIKEFQCYSPYIKFLPRWKDWVTQVRKCNSTLSNSSSFKDSLTAGWKTPSLPCIQESSQHVEHDSCNVEKEFWEDSLQSYSIITLISCDRQYYSQTYHIWNLNRYFQNCHHPNNFQNVFTFILSLNPFLTVP